MDFTIYGKNSKASVICDKSNKDKFYVKIDLNNKPRNSQLLYRAPAPYEARGNQLGGFPFPNKSVAYSKNNPNSGYATIQNNKAYFEINKPNSYYINAGSKIVPPHIYISFGDPNLDEVYDDILMLPSFMK
jgi:hypothetical protein